MLKEGDRLVTGHRLVRFLGRGNFGEVWQATAPGNTYTALKFLNLEQTQGRKEYRAIQPLKHLRHANLLQMTAIWLLDEKGEIIPDDVAMEGAPYLLETVRGTLATVPVLPQQHRASTLIIAMPFADKSLDQLLKEYKQKGEPGIPRDELLGYMEDAAKAIDFLNAPDHDLGQGPVAIRHCDVKPENLLLMGRSVVLCDFGVSRTILGSSATRKTTMGGSLAYMAPECLADDVTASSDQFSLAVSYLELRTGELPFEGESPAVVMEQRRRGVIDLSALPPAEAAVIRRATSLQPERRYPSSWAMVEALQQTCAPPKRNAGSSKLAFGALLIGGLGVAVAVGAFFMSRQPGGDSTELSQGERQSLPAAWEPFEKGAHDLIKQPELSESQFQEAVDRLTKAIDAGLPDNRLVFPYPLPPVVDLKLTSDEMVYELAFNPMAYSSTHGIAGLQRTADGLTVIISKPGALKQSPSRVLDSSFQFKRIGNLGWLDDDVAVFAQSGDARQFVAALPTNGEQRQVLFDNSENKLIDVCLAPSGKRAVVVDWDSKTLTTLDDPGSSWTLPELDPDDDPLIQVNFEGNWAAILTATCFYVANLNDATRTFHRLDLGSERSGVERKTFSIQVDDKHGWLTTDTGLDDAKPKLMQFALADPQDYETLELPAELAHVTCASLQKTPAGVSLFVGYATSFARTFPDVTSLAEPIDSTLVREDAYEHEVVVNAIRDSSSDGPQWETFGTRDGRIFLQRLEKNFPTMEIAQTGLGVPRQMRFDNARIAVGFEKGAIALFDFNHCRLIYEASVQKKKTPRPSPVTSTVKS